MDFYQKYYGQLVGFHIHRVSFDEDEDGLFPVLHLRDTSGTDLRFVLSSDEEGNGPGFAFIEPGEDDHTYDHACDDENCVCRSSPLWPDNIRHGCVVAEENQ